MPNIGTTELVLFLLIILIIFGAGKLPQVGESLGKAVKGFRETQKEIENTKEELKDAVSLTGSDQEKKQG